jgi:two-component system chemotaxis response regulator CheY
VLENNTLQPGEPVEVCPQSDLARSYHILVVDDEPLSRGFNAKVLADAGHQVEVAEDGAAAWSLLQISGYDLLITDHDMPGMSGVELLLKLHAHHLSLPTIMASGTMPTEELESYPWLQIEARLSKPYAIGKLLATADVVLRATAAAHGHTELLSHEHLRPVTVGLRP